MPRSGIAGSRGSPLSNFMRNHQTDFQSGFTRLEWHQQWRSVPLPPHTLQHLLSPEVFILAILTGMRWKLKGVLICISLITKDSKNFFRCFRAIQVSSVEISLFSSVPHFLNSYLILWRLTSCLYTLDISPLSLLVAVLSYWQCPLRGLWFLELKPFVFYSGKFPLCPCVHSSSPLSPL